MTLDIHPSNNYFSSVLKQFTYFIVIRKKITIDTCNFYQMSIKLYSIHGMVLTPFELFIEISHIRFIFNFRSINNDKNCYALKLNI